MELFTGLDSKHDVLLPSVFTLILIPSLRNPHPLLQSLKVHPHLLHHEHQGNGVQDAGLYRLVRYAELLP